MPWTPKSTLWQTSKALYVLLDFSGVSWVCQLCFPGNVCWVCTCSGSLVFWFISSSLCPQVSGVSNSFCNLFYFYFKWWYGLLLSPTSCLEAKVSHIDVIISDTVFFSCGISVQFLIPMLKFTIFFSYSKHNKYAHLV